MFRQAVMLFVVAILGTLLVGCAASTQKSSQSGSAGGVDLPDWITNPTVEGGLSTVECSRWSGDISSDKGEASALARATLVKQIDTKVEVMDKTYKRKVGTEEGQSTGSVFSSVSKQVAKKHLKGATVKKQEVIEVDGQKQWCVLMTMNPKKTKKLVEDIMKQSKAELDPQDERVLYEEFKAEKAQEELDKEIEKFEENR